MWAAAIVPRLAGACPRLVLDLSAAGSGPVQRAVTDLAKAARADEPIVMGVDAASSQVGKDPMVPRSLRWPKLPPCQTLREVGDAGNAVDWIVRKCQGRVTVKSEHPHLKGREFHRVRHSLER
jgi:hypothetical protein